MTPVQLLPGQSVSAIALADFDGDGRPDLAATTEITASSQPALYVLLNTGSASQPYAATQTLHPDLDLGGECYSVAVGDLDGDSRPDLVFGCQRPAFNASPAPTNPALGAIYLNNGTATANASDGSVTYQSASGYSGADTFQYTVSDGLGVVSNAAAVNIRMQLAALEKHLACKLFTVQRAAASDADDRGTHRLGDPSMFECTVPTIIVS